MVSDEVFIKKVVGTGRGQSAKVIPLPDLIAKSLRIKVGDEIAIRQVGEEIVVKKRISEGGDN